MKNHISLFACFFINLVSMKSGIAAPQHISLEECYNQAITHSEQVQISEEEIRIARHRYWQALGTALPTVSFNYRNSLQDPVSGSDENGFTQNFSRLSRSETSFSLRQPLFQGFREIQAIKLSKVEQNRRQLLLREAKREVLQDLATIFYTIMRIERNIDSIEKILQIARQQLEDLKREFELGKIRQAEIPEQKSEILTLEAELEQLKGSRAIAYETLSFFTGLSPQPPIRHQVPAPAQENTLEFYTSKVQERPDVKAAYEYIAIAQGNTVIARSALLPRAEISANIYPYRDGFLNSSRWDALLELEVPMFNVENYAKYRESKSQKRIVELQAQELLRQAKREVAESFKAVRSNYRQWQKYRQAAQSAEQYFKLQQRDFSLGLIANQNLLLAQRKWLDTLRLKNFFEMSYWLEWIQLQAKAGILL